MLVFTVSECFRVDFFSLQGLGSKRGQAKEASWHPASESTAVSDDTAVVEIKASPSQQQQHEEQQYRLYCNVIFRGARNDIFPFLNLKSKTCSLLLCYLAYSRTRASTALHPNHPLLTYLLTDILTYLLTYFISFWGLFDPNGV